MISWTQLLTVLGITSFLAFLWQFLFNLVVSKRKKKNSEDSELRKGVQALLRDRLSQEYKVYTEKGCISLDEKSNYENMYKSYHALGKNGVMDTLYSEVMKLPITNKKEK